MCGCRNSDERAYFCCCIFVGVCVSPLPIHNGRTNGTSVKKDLKEKGETKKKHDFLNVGTKTRYLNELLMELCVACLMRVK